MKHVVELTQQEIEEAVKCYVKAKMNLTGKLSTISSSVSVEEEMQGYGLNERTVPVIKATVEYSLNPTQYHSPDNLHGEDYLTSR